MTRIEMPKGWKVQTTVFYADSPASAYEIPSGCGGAILMRDKAVDVRGPLPSGELVIVCPQNPEARWPVVVALFDWKDAQKWRGLTKTEVNRMLDRCHRGAMRFLNGQPIDNGNKKTGQEIARPDPSPSRAKE